MMKLAVGTRVYNHGDIENPSHFGTITKVKPSKWGDDYELTPDKGSLHRTPYWISASSFSETFEGHSGTRLVTKQAYDRYYMARYGARARPPTSGL